MGSRARGGGRRRITLIGETVLHAPCQPVPESALRSEELRGLVADLHATMTVADGVGLAANQVGIPWRLFVFDVRGSAAESGQPRRGHVVNPVLTELDTAAVVTDEGCLSVPGPVAPVSRARSVRVSGVDCSGEPVDYEAEGFLARVFQHEVDHLDGLLYVDHLRWWTRRSVTRHMLRERDGVWMRWDTRQAERRIPWSPR